MKKPNMETQGFGVRRSDPGGRAARSSCVFGPVPSRRLGRSLGVDLMPFKTCTYDCIYCQLGHTTCKTIERKEWVPLAKVVPELKMRLNTRPDYITLSGSGEPTLYSRLAELIDAIKIMTDIPVAVLTNGSLLWQPEVRAQLSCADVVIPSLGASDKPDRYSYKAVRMLREKGHTPYPVHPALVTVDGLPVSASLRAIPASIDTITVYLSARNQQAIAEEILNRGPAGSSSIPALRIPNWKNNSARKE